VNLDNTPPGDDPNAEADLTFAATGWIIVGSTSASSPFVAGTIALAGNPARYPDASYFYAHPGALNDVTDGNNAITDCGGDYQCTAGAGYDGPTGNGTPNGLTAFQRDYAAHSRAA
jgi:hypothetical protein